MFSFKSILYYSHNSTTICLNCYSSFTLFRVHNNNCSIDLFSRDLQTIIILFTCNVSSHKTDWILSELPLPAMSYLLYCRVGSLMNALEGICLCLREISINVNKLLAMLLLLVYLIIRFISILHFVVACSFFIRFFYTDVVAIHI